MHIQPSRRPAFVWLGIDRIDLQQQATAQQQATTSPAPLAAANASHSEGASSTATGSSIQDHTHLRHLSSGTLNTSSATQGDSHSTSSKGLKRGAVALEPSSAQKCARTAATLPSNILYGTVTSPQRLPPSASFYNLQANREDAGAEHSEGAAEPGYSPTLGQQSEAGAQGKLGLRPTPVPITPEGGQPDGGQQRHEVSHACLRVYRHAMIVIALLRVLIAFIRCMCVTMGRHVGTTVDQYGLRSLRICKYQSAMHINMPEKFKAVHAQHKSIAAIFCI